MNKNTNNLKIAIVHLIATAVMGIQVPSLESNQHPADHKCSSLATWPPLGLSPKLLTELFEITALKLM